MALGKNTNFPIATPSSSFIINLFHSPENGFMTSQPISYTQEIYRKLLHLAALVIPITYAFCDRWIMLMGLVPLTLLVISLDSLRHTSPKIKALTQFFFGAMLREHEAEGEHKPLSGASYMMIAACGCVLFLPKLVGITAFSVLVISDTAAALIGRAYGKRRFVDKDKTVEGALAFITSGVVVVFAVGLIGNAYEPVPWEFYLAGIVAVVGAAYVEAISKRMQWDDNISIPVAVGGMMLLLGFLTGSYLIL